MTDRDGFEDIEPTEDDDFSLEGDLGDEIEVVHVDECGIEVHDEDEEDETVRIKGELEEARDEYLRLYAEFENFKKRANKDKDDLARYANENIIMELLPSVDNLEIALKHADDEVTNEAFLEGVQMTLRELYRIFEKFGVKPIKAEGEAFDPEFHHAVAHLEVDDMEEGMVVVELRKGFTLHGKILRASMVSVSKKPSGEQPDDE